ncbi:hypothetical protein BX285_5066 [Streptomyces sp. 1114.5]|uniref:hypothetical protein n=1 Tax=unclassified Streptomyces TaxID=2593676 RepID=UPI000BDB7AEB|nr:MULTISPECIES: hypothetical protein [unclassified Streptomyces]RKT11131.1 hypothetical protein BX285_5066 [Streptomyces sp. 1114.5]SOB81537.1 hypothetical protein SAMN06272789_1673 [Streptomyces sp. 1331.2]
MTFARSAPATGTTRPWLGRAAALITVLTCLFIGIVLAGGYVGTLLVVGLVVLYLVLAGVGLVKLRGPGSDPGYKDVGGALALVALAVIMATAAGGDAWQNLVLSSGREVNAVVVSAKADKSSRGSTTWSYALASADGAGVPGGPLAQDSERFRPGDTVTVRMDPAGRVAPKLPGEAGSTASLWSVIGLNAGIAVLLLWFARFGSRPRRKAPSAAA